MNILKKAFSSSDLDDLPRNLTDLANELDTRIHLDYLADGDTGSIVRFTRGGPAYLVLNHSSIPIDRRAAVAHGLGHVYQHRNGAAFRIHRGERLIKRYERFADAFAAELLMPEAELFELLRLGASIPSMLESLRVPEEALVERLHRLQ
jgi:hypothetical protein